MSASSRFQLTDATTRRFRRSLPTDGVQRLLEVRAQYVD